MYERDALQPRGQVAAFDAFLEETLVDDMLLEANDEARPGRRAAGSRLPRSRKAWDLPARKAARPKGPATVST